MTLDEMRDTFLKDAPKDDEGMSVEALNNLFEDIKAHGADGIFYALGIAYNMGYKAAQAA